MNQYILKGLLICVFCIVSSSVYSQQVDYSVPYVHQENGFSLVKISSDNDLVAMPIVAKNRQKNLQWQTNRVLAISPDGKDLAYLSLRDGMTNIFIKDLSKPIISRQRTNRMSIQDFSYSPDGKYICFTEQISKKATQLFITDANQGFVCRQITSGSLDYSPLYSPDMANIYFTRIDGQGCSIWGYDVKQKMLSTYTQGMNPYPDGNSVLYVSRSGGFGKGEIWKVNFITGNQECVVSDTNKSFYSPLLSPNGQYLLIVGETLIENDNVSYRNTDIYVCNTDGSNLRQLTYHAADDLSPVWSKDGKYIYFISQRGSANAVPNIWRMNFVN